MIQNIANNVLQLQGDSKGVGKYFGKPDDVPLRSLSGKGSGIMRPNTLQIPIAEEKSDSKKTGGTGGEDNALDDFLIDDKEEDNKLGTIQEGLIEESPCKTPAKEAESPSIIQVKKPMILQP